LTYLDRPTVGGGGGGGGDLCAHAAKLKLAVASATTAKILADFMMIPLLSLQVAPRDFGKITPTNNNNLKKFKPAPPNRIRWF
jgi:hypothetical protein